MTFQDILEAAQNAPTKRLAVVSAEDLDVLTAVVNAKEKDLIVPVLIGDTEEIKKIADGAGLNLEGSEFIEKPDHAAAAKEGIGLARDGSVSAVMKGQLHSSILMKAILNKEDGIREGTVLSHVGIIQSPKVDRFLFLTDGAMCTYPDLKQKVEIVQNAVKIARKMGVEEPKVAALAAVEVVNPDMQSTLDAAALSLMSQRGQIKDCIIDGPLALDNAINPEAVKHKGVKSPVGVAGHADVLLVPNIDAGNILLKGSRQLGDCQTVGLIAGAKVPVIMSSRADTAANKLLAIACAVYEQ